MRLDQTVKRLCPGLFATVDGALVDDIADRCDAADLGRQALYKGELATVGVHLIALPDEQAVDSFFALFDDRVRAVFWAWEGTEVDLYRHLRTIGKVEIPDAAADSAHPCYESVVFRHADPASLIQVLPVLDEPQRALFFGRSAGIIFEHRDRRGNHQLVRARRDGRLARDPVTNEPRTGLDRRASV